MKNQTRLIKPIALIIGFIASTLSGLNWNIGMAAWIAPVFLLYFIKNTKWSAFAWLYLVMAISAALSKTAENFSGIFFIYITTGLVHGVINSLPYLIEKLMVRKGNQFYLTLVFPSAVVLIEYLLSLLLGIWGNPSISQYDTSSLIQISSVFGIYSISFLMAWFASILNWLIQNKFETRIALKGLGIFALVFLAVMLYGQIRMSFFQPRTETVKISAIVSDVDIHEVFDKMEDQIIALSKDFHLEIPDSIYSTPKDIESQIQKTEQALKNGAKIVVWNEISLILNNKQKEILIQEIKKQCTYQQAFVLVAFLEKNNSSLPKPFNNKSMLITPEGEIAWEFLKYNPTPAERLIINQGPKTIPFIDTEYGRIANVICADLDMSKYMKQAAKSKIDILLVPAYDWEEITPYHSNMAGIAATQYGISIDRANGKGMVGFFDYQGNTVLHMNTLNTNSKIFYAELPVKSTSTIYSKMGDFLVILSALFLIFVVWNGIKRSND